MLGQSHRLDVDMLYVSVLNVCNMLQGMEFDPITTQKWALNRQMDIEGGFQGRANKLVDGCYSFWLGAIFPMIDAHWKMHGSAGGSPTRCGMDKGRVECDNTIIFRFGL